MSEVQDLLDEIAFLGDLLRPDPRYKIHISSRAGWVELWDPELLELGSYKREIKTEHDDENMISPIPVLITQRPSFRGSRYTNDEIEPYCPQFVVRTNSGLNEEAEGNCFGSFDPKIEDDSYEYYHPNIEQYPFQYSKPNTDKFLSDFQDPIVGGSCLKSEGGSFVGAANGGYSHSSEKEDEQMDGVTIGDFSDSFDAPASPEDEKYVP